MISPFEAIELLIEAGTRKVELNNDQPHCRAITLADTVEARAAELISHYQRRVQELLDTNNRYLDRARKAEFALDLSLARERVIMGIAEQREKHLAELQGRAPLQEPPLTASALAHALGAFWNAAIGDGRDRGGTALECASVVASGIAAVSTQLREGQPS